MIVAGVDGLRAGLEAAVWAAREAVLRNVPLRVVSVVPAWTLEPHGLVDPYVGVARWMADGGEVALAAALDAVRRAEPKLIAESELLPGDPRAALIEAAGDADLLVVGGTGLGAVRGMLIGSVANGVAGHARCDVVVVRKQPSPRPEVVAGVDGSAAQQSVLRFAFAEAALHGAELRVVLAWDWHRFAAPVADDQDRRGLTETLNGWIERYPDVPVRLEVVQGHPVDALRHAADGAEMLVVGSHGHGVLADMILGSVSQALLHHASCPLAVVRVDRARP